MQTAQVQPVSPLEPVEHQPAKITLVSLLTLATVSYVDYVTGYELLFFVFYFIPVGLCARYLGRVATLSMALLSAVSWFFVDALSAHQYPHETFRYWNTFICFLAFAIVGFILHSLKQSRDKEQKARRDLEQSLAKLEESTQEIRKLQSELQVVCAWTKRIKLEGKWVTLDEFLTSKLNVQVTHGISPEAFEEVKSQLNKE
jgi:K+-sensing histidine kinase KdpD